MQHRSVFLVGALLVAGSVSTAVAQEADRTHDFSSRGYALCFDFTSFDVGEFNGGIGGKLRTSETLAWTLSADAEYSDNESGGTSDVENQSRWVLGLALGFEKHRPITHRISPYLGADVQVNHGRAERRHAADDEREWWSTTWGADMLVGVECWILQDVSLAAQYDLGFRRHASKTKPDGSTDLETDSFSAGITSTSLTLSYYF